MADRAEVRQMSVAAHAEDSVQQLLEQADADAEAPQQHEEIHAKRIGPSTRLILSIALITTIAAILISYITAQNRKSLRYVSQSTDPASVQRFFEQVLQRPLPPAILDGGNGTAQSSTMVPGNHHATLPADPSEIIARLPDEAWESKMRAERLLQNGGGQQLDDLASISQQRQLNIANCVFNGLLASDKLAQAGLAINDAMKTCPDTSKQNACIANTGLVVAQMSLAGSFVAQMAFVCPETPEPYSMCAAPILNLVGAFGQITSAAGGLQQSCSNSLKENAGATVYSPVSVSKDTQVATCSVLASQAAFFLARVVLQIDNSVAACNHTNPGAVCSMAITSVLMSVGGLATTVSGAVGKCTNEAHFGAACSANINNVISGMAGIANFGSAMANHNCESQPL